MIEKKYEKRGDVKGPILIIFSLIIGIAIIIFGFKAITETKKTISNAKDIDFYTELKSSLIKIRSSYAEIKKISIPADKFSEICFYDFSQEIQIENILIKDAVLSNTANIFLMDRNNIERSDLVEGIYVENGELCIKNSNGKFSMTLEGLKNNKVGIYRIN